MALSLPVVGRRLLLVMVMLLLMAAPARAESANQPGGVDVILLLDRSGSMRTNDPQDLSATGAQAFVDMLDPADRVAVVAFDTTARPLLPLSPVGDGAAARRAIAGMGRPVGQWTDIKGALQAALDQLSQADSGRAPAVLLFTDGKPETQPDGVPAGYREEMAQVVSRLAGRSIPVFTVGLGEAEFTTLGQIAMGTRAESFAATASDQVVHLFADVLSRVKERQVVVSFSGPAGTSRTFQVPPYTRLLTLSGVGTGSVGLSGQAPGGTPLAAAPGLKVSKGANYSVYTIPSPAPGTWTVRLEGEGQVEAYGQAESALKISLVSPQPYSQVAADRPVPVRIAVAGDPDPKAPLEVWAQAGDGQPVKLPGAGGDYKGSLQLGDGRLAVWATRAGAEVARREFRVYPVAGLSTGGSVSTAPKRWLYVVGGAAAAIALAWVGGALNWRRIRRRDEKVSGRLGSSPIPGGGKVQPLGDLARFEARLVPKGPAALAGLGLAGREYRMYIINQSGVRLQINGRPPGDGRLYDGDEITIGGETYAFHNPRLPKRPAPRLPRGRRGQPTTTLKG